MKIPFFHWEYYVDYCCYDTVEEALKKMPKRLVFRWPNSGDSNMTEQELEDWGKELDDLCNRKGFISTPEDFIRTKRLAKKRTQ